MNYNKNKTRAAGGPGGITCYCCNNFKTVKAARTFHNRVIRRKLNALVKFELRLEEL